MLAVSSCGRIWCLWSSGNVKCQDLCLSGRCKMLGAFWEPTTQHTAVSHVTGNPGIQSALKKQQEWHLLQTGHFHFSANRAVAVSDKMTTLNPESPPQPWIPPSELEINAEDPGNRYISLGGWQTLLPQLLVYSHLCSGAWVVPLAFAMLSLAYVLVGDDTVVSLLLIAPSYHYAWCKGPAWPMVYGILPGGTHSLALVPLHPMAGWPHPMLSQWSSSLPFGIVDAKQAHIDLGESWTSLWWKIH